MNEPYSLRQWLLWLVLCVVAVVACLLYLDQPLAIFFDAQVRHTELWQWLNVAFGLLGLVVVIALLFLLVCAIASATGRRLGPWTRTPLLCAWSAMVAVAAEVTFKQIFGRAEPDPAYIHYHIYGFLHTGRHLGSFPSGTAAVSAAIASVLWIVTPRSRIAVALVVALLSALVVMMNYHWLSDSIAGVFLGVTVGWSTTRLQQSGFQERHE